jgi:cellulose synthase (UDP-forming)
LLVFLGIIVVFFVIIHLFYWRTLLLGKKYKENSASLFKPSHNIILITSFDEPIEILKSTINHAKKVMHIDEIYVLDDGNRLWLKELSVELQVVYIERLVNSDAKAGSLNNALASIKCDFALVLDADMLVDLNTMSIALPHFIDESVGIVQFPQEYYNTNSFQHWNHGEQWTDLSFGLRTVNIMRNYFKAGYWCGSPSILRMSSLKSIGGICVDSVTEDLATTLELMQSGSWVKTLNVFVGHCLAPTDYISYIIQRQRWSKGFFQLWWNRHNPIQKNISFSAKIEWFGDFLYHIQMSFYLIIINLLPFIMYVSSYDFSNLLNPLETISLLFGFVSVYLVNIKLAGPHYKIFPMHVYMRLSMLSVALGFVDSIFRDNSFEVTPKLNTSKFSLRCLRHKIFIIIILLLNAFSIYYYLHKLTSFDFEFLMLLLAASNFLFLVFGLRIIFRKTYNPSIC